MYSFKLHYFTLTNQSSKWYPYLRILFTLNRQNFYEVILSSVLEHLKIVIIDFNSDTKKLNTRQVKHENFSPSERRRTSVIDRTLTFSASLQNQVSVMISLINDFHSVTSISSLFALIS